MNKESTIALLLVFLLFVVQPVLLAIGARKAYRRSGTLWGLLAFLINAGTLAFFESQHRSSTIADDADEVGTIMIISAMLILAILEMLKSGSSSTRKELFRRGVFRVCTSISGGWLMLCTFEIITLPGNCYIGSCDFFVRTFFKDHSSGYYNIDANYFDIGKAFIGFPVLAFSVGLAVCWAVDGFKRSTAD